MQNKVPAASPVEFDDMLEFPTGLGYKRCTKEYREAIEARADARAARDEVGEYQADLRIHALQAAGHLGPTVMHDFDPQAAAMGCILSGNGLEFDRGRPVQGNPNIC